MSIIASAKRLRVLFAPLCVVFLSFAFTSVTAATGVPTTKISGDIYTNTTSQHKTQVEPDSYSFGSTIVSAVQSGRFTDGGASNIGWATSTDGGVTWKHGFLPGTTTLATPAGIYDRVSDPAVTYDARHATWLISSLAIKVSGGTPVGVAVIVNQSTNGGLTWKKAVTAQSTSTGFFDKDWIVCDNTASSSFYGNCYIEWDDASAGDAILMSASSTGGSAWGAALHPAGTPSGLGGQPLVQPGGTVIVPFESLSGTIAAYTSADGGVTWSAAVNIATINDHPVAGNLRSEPLPSAEIDGAGTVYVVWQDCRFESGCAANDIVMSTSNDGSNWSAVTRIPADAVGSGVDHFTPGIAVDTTTSGSSAHLGLAFYYYPVANCSTTTCQLIVGYVTSTDGGATWTGTQQLTSPMKVKWLASTTQGVMVGDYISTSFSGGKAFPLFVIAKKPATAGTFNEALYTVSSGLAIVKGSYAASSKGVVATQRTSRKLLTAY